MPETGSSYQVGQIDGRFITILGGIVTMVGGEIKLHQPAQPLNNHAAHPSMTQFVKAQMNRECARIRTSQEAMNLVTTVKDMKYLSLSSMTESVKAQMNAACAVDMDESTDKDRDMDTGKLQTLILSYAAGLKFLSW